MKILRQINFSNSDEKIIEHLAKDEKGLDTMIKEYKTALNKKDISEKDKKNLEGLLKSAENVKKNPNRFDTKDKEETKKTALKAGGSLVAGGALGMAIPAIASKKIEKEAEDKIISANKRIAAKRGLDYTPVRRLSGEIVRKSNGKPFMHFDSGTNSIDDLKKVIDADAVSRRYAKKVKAEAEKKMNMANAAGLAAGALGVAAAGTIAYKHHKNKKKESDKKD